MSKNKRICKKKEKRSLRESRRFERDYMSRSSTKLFVIRTNKAAKEFRSNCHSIKIDISGFDGFVKSCSNLLKESAESRFGRPVWCGSTLEPSPTEQHPDHLSIMVES